MLVEAVLALGIWHGPGDRACMGRCDRDWALGKLSEERQEALAPLLSTPPRRLYIHSGDVLSLMTYFDEGQVADVRGVQAILDNPEPAEGWCVRDGCFVQVLGCMNWAFLEFTGRLGGGFSAPFPVASVGALRREGRSVDPALFVGRSGGVGALLADAAVMSASSRAVAPTDPAPIPPVPLPGAVWMLLTALGALVAARRRA